MNRVSKKGLNLSKEGGVLIPGGSITAIKLKAISEWGAVL